MLRYRRYDVFFLQRLVCQARCRDWIVDSSRVRGVYFHSCRGHEALWRHGHVYRHGGRTRLPCPSAFCLPGCAHRVCRWYRRSVGHRYPCIWRTDGDRSLCRVLWCTQGQPQHGYGRVRADWLYACVSIHRIRFLGDWLPALP